MARIAIFDDEPEKVVLMAELFRLAGHEVRVIEVKLLDTKESVAARIAEFSPDMICADYILGEFYGYDVLQVLGGKFWSPGNPRVVSTSSRPHGAMPYAAGAHFPDKEKLCEGVVQAREAFTELFQNQLALITS